MTQDLASRLESYRRLLARQHNQNEGQPITADMLILNMQQAITQFNNSLHPPDRKAYWQALNLLAQDLVYITERPAPDISKPLYTQLESGS